MPVLKLLSCSIDQPNTTLSPFSHSLFGTEATQRGGEDYLGYQGGMVSFWKDFFSPFLVVVDVLSIDDGRSTVLRSTVYIMRALRSIAFISSTYTRSFRRIISLNMSTSINSEACSSNDTSLLRKHMKRLQSSSSETLILDGGTGEELFLRGVPDDRKIWSAKAIVDSQYHSTLFDTHQSFIDAGSQAITTNSYGITPGVGFTDGEEVKRLVGISGEIARKAATKSSNPVLVLGSLGPLVESYRADLIMKHDDGCVAYQYAVEGLHPYIDCYLAETMSCCEEACQALHAISKYYSDHIKDEIVQHPVLVSFTLNSDGKARNGESVVDAMQKLIEYSHDKDVELVGVLFNCCEPEAISKALDEIEKNQQFHKYLQHRPIQSISSEKQQALEDVSPKILLGAYANRLTPVESDWTLESSEEAQGMREDLSPVRYSEFVNRWHGRCKRHTHDLSSSSDESIIDQRVGLQLIGGCCGIGPQYISVLTKKLKE